MYHELSTAYKRYCPHEMLFNRQNVQGEWIHPLKFTFDLICWRAAARIKAALAKNVES